MVRNDSLLCMVFVVHILCSPFHTSLHKKISVIELPPVIPSRIQMSMEVRHGTWIA